MKPDHCACGLPLHYADPTLRESISKVNAKFGDYLTVKQNSHAFRVQRHYIALHGIRNKNFAELGFQEVENEKINSRPKNSRH